MSGSAALIAIVDDEESIRRALLRVFRLAEFRAEAFASAAAFLEFYARQRPDCVILDLHMPGISGGELLQRFATLDSPPPVIVVTADSDSATQMECMALGTKYYFSKPVDSRTLIDSVRTVVAGARH
jgi:FixJ family two-component response regulator